MMLEFETKWSDVKERLPGLFWRLGVPDIDIPDLVSEAGYQAFIAKDNFRTDGDFNNWVFGIAKNVQKRYWRERVRVSRQFDGAVTDFLVHTSGSIDEITAERAALDHCLKELTDTSREVLFLRALEGYKFREISEKVGKPVSWVARHYEKARLTIKDCVEKSLPG
jgi:RNA polymerase sigma factor (sigma-70 family)